MVLEYGGYKRNISNNINEHVSVNQKLDFITQGLSLKGTFALSNYWGYTRQMTRQSFPDYQYNKVSGELELVKPNRNPMPTLNSSSIAMPPFRKISSNLVLTYARDFKRHGLSGMFLFNWDSSIAGSTDPTNLKGMSGRISYNYAHRYILEVNMGYNGSDRFKGNKRYGLFPAISAGWKKSL